LAKSNDRIEAALAGCSMAEETRCDGSVGYGNHSDDAGHVRLDAMVMDGCVCDVSHTRVMCIDAIIQWAPSVRSVIFVMQRALLTLSACTLSIHFLSPMTPTNLHEKWVSRRRLQKRPNRWHNFNSGSTRNVSRIIEWFVDRLPKEFFICQNVSPDPHTSCGPYKPARCSNKTKFRQIPSTDSSILDNHDTIGMLVMDANRDITVATSTNGLWHKVAG
jgi:isoaspartyl peptidase/L-asparaginase-like protein (Ntn-hydrolase superfamily)